MFIFVTLTYIYIVPISQWPNVVIGTTDGDGVTWHAPV